MNAKHLIAALSVFAAGSAFAGQIYPFVEHTSNASTVSRSEVKAAIAQPSAASADFTDYTRVATEKSRAEVRAELTGEHEFQVARNPEFTDPPRFASSKTRDEVHQEAIRAAKAAGKVSGS